MEMIADGEAAERTWPAFAGRRGRSLALRAMAARYCPEPSNTETGPLA